MELNRLPELFCGFHKRSDLEGPTLYFGTPEVIPGRGYSGLAGDFRKALHWDHGVSIVEYQQSNCTGNEHDNDKQNPPETLL
jgi:hypothetical protein